MSGRRLRVLVGYPGLGKPGDIRDASLIQDPQAHVDLGNAEWLVERALVVETTEALADREQTTTRRTPRKVTARRDLPTIETR